MGEDDLTAVLRADSPFYEIFPNGIVPVRLPVMQTCDLEGHGREACYMLAAERCSSEQLEAVAAKVAELFNARVKDVRDELIERGLPIRASQVAVHPVLSLRSLL